MHTGRRIALAAAASLICSAASAADGVVVAGPAGQQTMTGEKLAALPVVKLDVSFGTEHGPRQAVFEGPLLWTVLAEAGAIDTGKPRESVRQTITVAGSDGYTAVLALGEISPEFEGKQVIVAEREDGKPLDPARLRLVVPGDKRGGRSVHDLVSITVRRADGS